MGLPDFLKFAVRSAPDALVPLSKSPKQKLKFDFVLVDATNAAQTIGFDQLFELLVNPSISVSSAILFAVDSQRDRTGSARQYRQSRAVVGDLDVKVQEFCVRLSKAFGGRSSSPLLLVSGRGVAGEADYKVMDLHRSIVSRALFHNKPIPSFLFVSEDSDILCGTLCGPAPHKVSIATSLHDTTFRLNILRLSHVVTYVAACVDALASEVPDPSIPDSDAIQEKKSSETTLIENMPVAVPATEDVEAGRRRKKDGPMIATGTRVQLSSSDSDDSSDTDEQQNMSESISSVGSAPFASLTPFDLTAGWITHSSCIDLVFLFQLIMGNGADVPPLVRGVTKIDVQSCWAAYCRHKYAGPASTLNGKNLVVMSSSKGKGDFLKASLDINCSFLNAILESVHYTDCVSRPPVQEEKEKAIEFLSSAVYGTLRYVVACNVESGGSISIKDTFLDSRPQFQAHVLSPSLAAIMWVISNTPTLPFVFSLNAKPGAEDEHLVKLQNRDVLASEKMDVGDNLVAPAVTTSWAVRVAGPKKMTIEEVLGRTIFPDLKKEKAISISQHLFSASKNAILSLRTPAGEYKLPLDLFHAIRISWALTVSAAVPEMRTIGATTRFLSPVTGGIVIGPTRTSSTNNQEMKHRMTYSFELRRMAPIIDGEGHADDIESSSQTALLKALGVSLDYATQPVVQAPAQSLERPRKKHKPEANSSTAIKGGDEPCSEAKKKSRPGKKERMRHRATMSK
eukprot:gene5054-3641_t